METQSLLSLPSLPLFLSRSPSINCSTSYLQEASISQETNVISKLCMSPSGWKEAVLLLLLGFWGFFLATQQKWSQQDAVGEPEMLAFPKWQ